MKWVALFVVAIGDGAPIEMVDADGPRKFPTEQACLDHVREAVPRMNDILVSRVPNLDTLLIGECKPEED